MCGNSGCATGKSPAKSISSRYTCCHIGKTFRSAPKTRPRMAMAFPGKEILIGETGWPSKGRMRDGALPSRINQARFYSGILDRSKQENFRVILFEAYDEPWKRQWEGTVGGYWGLFDGKHRSEEHTSELQSRQYL